MAFPPLSYALHTAKGELSASTPPSSASGDFLLLCILCASAASSFEPNPNAPSGERNFFFLEVQFQQLQPHPVPKHFFSLMNRYLKYSPSCSVTEYNCLQLVCSHLRTTEYAICISYTEKHFLEQNEKLCK